jgi:hypothetical protein
MKSIIGIGTLALALSTTTWAHESASKVEYKGDTSARKVCLSIVEDNVSQLKSALRSDRLRNKRLGNNADTYSCNGLALVEFADANEAYNTVNYLAPERLGRVDMEDVASR